jgi:hypothetical protein
VPNAAAPGPRIQTRGTQSFVATLSSVWRRPWLLALEVAWRWSFGAPALALTLFKLRLVLLAATDGTLDPARLGLDPALLRDPVGALSADPMGAAAKFATAYSLIAPGIQHLAVWLVPLILIGWIVQSAVGRTIVLRSVDASLHVRVGTLMLLQAIRVAALTAVFALWFHLVGWSARTAITGPIAERSEPNLVLFCGLVIVLSLTMFCAWAAVSWVVGMAPLLAMTRNLGPVASLRATVTLGRVRARLVEINLVLGIVKIMLIVLGMVFSATPLPFSSVESTEFLAWWWFGVFLLYLIASDFFHVARIVGYLDLWRSERPSASIAPAAPALH